LEYAKSGDLQKARALSNPEVAPHLSFADIGRHGYAHRSGDLRRFRD
jgi:alkaline phosphatase D